VEDGRLAERSYADIARNAELTTGMTIKDRRLFRAVFDVDGERLVAEVGAVTELNGEIVFAIFESDAYLVCTTNRGALRSEPLVMDPASTLAVEEFVPQRGSRPDNVATLAENDRSAHLPTLGQ
jgi:hypothetical protein